MMALGPIAILLTPSVLALPMPIQNALMLLAQF